MKEPKIKGMSRRRYLAAAATAVSLALIIYGLILKNTTLMLVAWLMAATAISALLIAERRSKDGHVSSFPMTDTDSGSRSRVSNAPSGAAAVIDQVTGMANENFFSAVLGPKMATARRRLWPVSVVLIHVIFASDIDEPADRDRVIGEFAALIKMTIREADVACRISEQVFGLILDDTDEDGGAWTAERIQIAQSKRGNDRIAKVSAGIASYPNHGMEPTQVLSKAREALERACSNVSLPGLGIVIVAPQGPISG